MGLFSKNKDKKEPSIPKLPELPSLPSRFPELDDDYSDEEIHELPSFPNSSMGDKFSRETIKNAVAGKEEDEEEEPEEVIPTPKFNKVPAIPEEKEIPRVKIPSKFQAQEVGTQRGPVFIQIDKFEDALKVFNETKDKITEVEKLLEETKELKEKEEEELSTWETELQEMKQEIEKVNEDIFSRV